MRTLRFNDDDIEPLRDVMASFIPIFSLNFIEEPSSSAICWPAKTLAMMG